MDLLGRLLRERPVPIEVGPDVAGWWPRFLSAVPESMSPFERAVLAGFRADRVAGAFVGGYQGALRALAPGWVAGDTVGSFCVSEAGGNAPRAIEARLVPRDGGGFALTGRKRWSTMAPLASVLLVAAHAGVDAAGRKDIRLVRLRAGAPGVTVRRMPPPAFLPEIPHAELDLEQVAVAADDVLPGDGYTGYVKRFRTVEDVHIHGAVLGYVLSAARRFGFPDPVIEGAAAAILTARALAGLDPDAAETHLVLAGALARDASLLDRADAHWEAAAPAERDGWRRDRAAFGSVAGALRESRRLRAWERLRGHRSPG